MTRARPLLHTTATMAAAVPPFRAVIVEESSDVRFLLATVMELDGRFEVVAEANDAASALRAVADTDPDVVLVELWPAPGTSASMIRDLRRGGTAACIVVMAASTPPEDHAAVLGAGADAVQVTSSMTSTLVDDLAELVGDRVDKVLVAHRGSTRDLPPSREVDVLL